jgi:uncharacterized membrane protein
VDTSVLVVVFIIAIVVIRGLPIVIFISLDCVHEKVLFRFDYYREKDYKIII